MDKRFIGLSCYARLQSNVFVSLNEDKRLSKSLFGKTHYKILLLKCFFIWKRCPKNAFIDRNTLELSLA